MRKTILGFQKGWGAGRRMMGAGRNILLFV